MEYERRIDSIQGNYIVTTGLDFEEILIKKPIELASCIIGIGETTNMHEWFTKPCKYVGFLTDSEHMKEAVFFLGKGNADLLNDGGYYYDVTFIIQPDRIGKSYRAGSFRDSFLRKNKKGEFFWK